jgi:hypothetical protein
MLRRWPLDCPFLSAALRDSASTYDDILQILEDFPVQRRGRIGERRPLSSRISARACAGRAGAIRSACVSGRDRALARG